MFSEDLNELFSMFFHHVLTNLDHMMRVVVDLNLRKCFYWFHLLEPLFVSCIHNVNGHSCFGLRVF
jgi:hypothetical protein